MDAPCYSCDAQHVIFGQTIAAQNMLDNERRQGMVYVEPLIEKLKEYESSESKYMIVGIFDLSDANPDVPNHMVGINGLPDAEGNFSPENIVPTSNGDRYRLGNSDLRKAYNINNLKEIRVIFIDD